VTGIATNDERAPHHPNSQLPNRMLSGYILIGVILILGGIIAVSGDRIGTRVGKARLSLFKLRPRQTATLVTIATGTLISGTVLTLMFGASEQLRVGVFDLQKIQRKLSDTSENLARALEQKDRVQQELEAARNAQSEAKNLLSGIDRSLKDELLKQSTAAQNFQNTERQLTTISAERNELVNEVAEIARNRDDLAAQRQVVAKQVDELQQRLTDLDEAITPLQQQYTNIALKKSQLQQQLDLITVKPNLLGQIERLQTYERTAKKLSDDLEQHTAKSTNLDTQRKLRQTELLNLDTQLKQLQQKQAVRQAQLTEKDRQHQKLEREFQTRATQLKLRNIQLKKLEAQIRAKGQGIASLEKEVNNIEQEYQKIRQGNIAILRDRVLATSILKVSSPTAATKALNALLTQANLNALKAIDPDNPDRTQQVIEISPARLTELKQQIADRRDYVVRIFSIGNYVVGDRNIQVFIDATPNRKLFAQNTQIAEVSLNPEKMTEEQIRQQFNILLVASQLRAKRAGILDDRPQVGDGELITYVQFVERVKQEKYPIDIRTVVDRDIYTLGPMAVQLQAVANGRVLFSTHSNATISSSSVQPYTDIISLSCEGTNLG
jgi:uncharacterized protein (DUF3084 family)